MSELLRLSPHLIDDVSSFQYRPLVSVVMPLPDSVYQDVGATIDSMLGQRYPNWELFVSAKRDDVQVREAVGQRALTDERVTMVTVKEPANLASLANRALDLATGDLVAFLGSDDLIAPDALYWVVRALQHVHADLIYCDEDEIDADGRSWNPSFKPAWSPDLLLSCMYIPRFSVFKRQIAVRIGGFREGFDGAHDYDFLLRYVEHATAILHIPRILNHNRKRSSRGGVHDASSSDGGREALEDALRRRGIDGEVRQQREGVYRVKRSIVRSGRVSIVIPTRDNHALLKRCLRSIKSTSGYGDYEIVVVDNGSQTAETREYLEALPHRVIRDNGPFNYSRLNNLGAQAGDGEYLLLLNDDTEVITDEWLAAMLEHAQRPEVGIVGARLLYPDGGIQHAGVVLGVGGVAGHAHKFTYPGRDTPCATSADVIRNYSAVTGACLMMRRDLFLEMGGLNEALAVSFNDIDLCLRFRRRGYLVVYTPYATLLHHESASRTGGVDQGESSFMWSTWRDDLAEDLYYNPNLSRRSEDFSSDLSKPECSLMGFSQDRADEVIGSMRRLRYVRQAFQPAAAGLCGIAIKFATYTAPCDGTVRMRLGRAGGSQQDLVVMAVNASSIHDNEYHGFFFHPIQESGGWKFVLSLEFEPGRSGDLTIWKGSETDPRAGPYVAGGRTECGTISLRAYVVASRERLFNLRQLSQISEVREQVQQ